MVVKALRLGGPFAATGGGSSVVAALVLEAPMVVALPAALMCGALGATALWYNRTRRPVRAGLVGIVVAAVSYFFIIPWLILMSLPLFQVLSGEFKEALRFGVFIVGFGFAASFWFTLPLGFLSGYIAQRNRLLWDPEPVLVGP